MYEEILREVGLSLNESKIYETLLQLGEASVQTISLKSKVHRRNVYDSLNKLGATEIKTIPMHQGNKITRIVAWTFLSKKEQQEWNNSL